MVYIVAGATGVVGTAISKELSSENEVIIIGTVSYTHLTLPTTMWV